MVKRSLRASMPGIQQAKRAFSLKGWTQENLAGEVGLKTRQSIWRFFTGQPIERQIFQEICLLLELDWREVAIDPPSEFPHLETIKPSLVADIDTLVRQVRSQLQDKIQGQCGTLQLVDISRPAQIDDLFIDVNILEEIPSHQWLELADLQCVTANEFDPVGLEKISQTQIAGMEAVEIYSKLRVLGKLGAGKTTFLQHLAIRCNRGSFAANRVPIFVTLRDFADESSALGEFSLLNYMREVFLNSGISNPSVIETLLREGRLLLLLDGLDEVTEQERKIVANEIRKLAEKYQRNLFVVTCRTGAKSANLLRFTDVEMAPFTPDQMMAFAQKWFTTLTKTTPQAGQKQAVQLVEQLNRAENAPFRRLSVTPLFLHLACWVFHFQGKLPTRRSEFYKHCLDLLLSKWDEVKGIERDEIYHGFLLPQKLKLLSQIATITFEQGDYFFEQRAVEQHICDYIRDLPNATTEPEELQLESAGILNAIALQHGLLAERSHGVFSFLDQIFQEYFTARKIVASHNLQASNQSLEQLVSHITDPRWQEIFLLTFAMLRNADSLVQLMKQQIDAIVVDDPHLQAFLTWASRKALATPPPMHAFYFALAPKPHLVPLLALSSTFAQEPFLDAIILDDLVLKCKIDSGADLTSAQVYIDALNTALIVVSDGELHHALQCLNDQLPDPTKDRKRFQTWWQTHALEWTKQLRSTIAKYRDTQRDWNFSLEQQRVLQQYYDANQLLLDCLNSNCEVNRNCEVTAAVRQKIETALLLPQKELEDHISRSTGC